MSTPANGPKDDTPSAAPDEDEDEARASARAVQSPLRRNAPLYLAVLVVLAISPAITHVLSSYRGVVLSVEEDEMLLGFAERPPESFDTIGANPGEIVAKAALTWSPGVVAADPADHQLLTMHARYVQTYTGIILELTAPMTPTGATTALVQLDTGGKLTIPLYGEHLAAAHVGSIVKKVSGTWEPYLVSNAVRDVPGTVSLEVQPPAAFQGGASGAPAAP